MALLSPGVAVPSGKTVIRSYGSQCLSPPVWWPRRFPPESFSRQRGSGRTQSAAKLPTQLPPQQRRELLTNRVDVPGPSVPSKTIRQPFALQSPLSFEWLH